MYMMSLFVTPTPYPQVMIVHQQLAALSGKPKKKKKATGSLIMNNVDVTDPLYSPSIAAPPPPKKKQKKKTVKDPVIVPTKKPASAATTKVAKPAPQPKKTTPSSK